MHTFIQCCFVAKAIDFVQPNWTSQCSCHIFFSPRSGKRFIKTLNIKRKVWLDSGLARKREILIRNFQWKKRFFCKNETKFFEKLKKITKNQTRWEISNAKNGKGACETKIEIPINKWCTWLTKHSGFQVNYKTQRLLYYRNHHRKQCPKRHGILLQRGLLNHFHPSNGIQLWHCSALDFRRFHRHNLNENTFTKSIRFFCSASILFKLSTTFDTIAHILHWDTLLWFLA